MKAIVAVRRGRPPLERQPRDLGTPELIKRRAMLVGGGDPALATTPLGIMLARQLIDLDLFSAGERYRSLYGSATGTARAVGLDIGLGTDPLGEALERITEQYRAATDALLRLGRPALREVINVAVFQDKPVWLILYLNNPHRDSWRVHRNHCDCIALLDGLHELDRMLGR